MIVGALCVWELAGGASLGDHSLQSEHDHLQGDVQRARLQARASDEGVAKLGGEGRVEPDRRRVRVQRLLARRDG